MNSYLVAFFLYQPNKLSNTISNVKIDAYKLLFVLNSSITFENCNFTLFSSTCSNDVNIIPGLISIFNIHFEDVESYL